MKDKIMKILNHPVKGIYFLGIVAVYFLIVLTDFSFSFYTFLAYGQEIKEANLYKKYTLTYNSQGGSSCASQTQYSGQAWGTLCAPTKTGYTFGGWYTGTNGDGDEVTSSTNATQNIVVYADYYQNTLYDVIRVARKTGYAKKYTGSHQDSMDASLSTNSIYHWYGSDDTNGTAILDKNNVIFANHCWQMIRTTDTGGVRMIYNGEVVDGKCLNTRGNHFGYSSGTIRLSSNYWYGTDYTYNNGTFSISGTTSQVRVTSSNASTVIPTLVGQYTCRSTTESGTCTTLYLIRYHESGIMAGTLLLNSTTHYSQIGKSFFYNRNSVYFPLADVGYMHNTVYDGGTLTHSINIFQNSARTTNGYYSESVSYSSSTNNYTLINPQPVSSLSDLTQLVGKYWISSGSTNSLLQYVVGVDDSWISARILQNGDLDISMVVGDSYIDNGNGTYTIQNATPITYIEWKNLSEADLETYKGKFVCSGTSSTCSDLRHIINRTPYESGYSYFTALDNYKYGSDINYSNGTYTLTGDIQTIWDLSDANEMAKLDNHRYSCHNLNTSCTTVKYIAQRELSSIRYMELTGVDSVSTALTNMLSADDVNANDSFIKFQIDYWYANNMMPYDSYIDDTIYCNNRTIKSLGGFNPAESIIENPVMFEEYDSTGNLGCTNITDKFSVSNSSAQLTYKVGLITKPEMYLLGAKPVRVTGQSYFLMSPTGTSTTDINGRVSIINSSGGLSGSWTNTFNGVRPAISLVAGLKYSSGDGSMANPYVVDLNSLSS